VSKLAPQGRQPELPRNSKSEFGDSMNFMAFHPRETVPAGTFKSYHIQSACSPQYASLLVVFLLVQTQAGDVGASREIPAHYSRFFRALGHRVRSYRVERKLTQEDMISYGFSVRHWQMVESGRPITLFTLLRICEAFDVAPEEMVEGLARHLRKRKKG
jgi:DNA-binding Xre family transcriptional regulator